MVRSKQFLKANIEKLVVLISGESSHLIPAQVLHNPPQLKNTHPCMQVLQPMTRVLLSPSIFSLGQFRMRRAMPRSLLTLMDSTTWRGFLHEPIQLLMPALTLCWLE